MQLPLHHPRTSYTVGDVLHHPLGQGNACMILIIDVLMQFRPRLLPWSLYQLQQSGELCLTVDQGFYTYVLLRDTATPYDIGVISNINVDFLDHFPHADFPWIKIGEHPDWVPHFHPHQQFVKKPIPFDLTPLVATQDRLLRGEGGLPEQESC